MTRTQRILSLLRDYESPNVLAIAPDLSAPMVWERARGVCVWDAAGRKYLDLTAAFGVTAAGHANPRVVAAGRRQMGLLLHAMGDVFPHARKAELARELSRITFERWTATGAKSTRQTGKTIFTNSGFEAIEAALKTALLATSKPGVLAFTGGYHGLGYGALNATHRQHFRGPFRPQLRNFASFARFPKEDADLPHLEREINKIHSTNPFGAILVEPVQGRGGINVPPAGFLPLLRQLCDRFGALLILDEIYTGFGRTGQWFACEHSATVPDLICLGKALTGGFPLSACVGRADIMDAAWPRSTGEAIHTSTYLGHPVGCAMALAQIKEIETKSLVVRSATLGKFLLNELRTIFSFASSLENSPGARPSRSHSSASRRRNLSTETDSPSPEPATPSSMIGVTSPKHQITIRGLGLMVGVEIVQANGSTATALRIIREMERGGFIVLPEGESSNIISFTPPLTITKPQLTAAIRSLAHALKNAVIG